MITPDPRDFATPEGREKAIAEAREILDLWHGIDQAERVLLDDPDDDLPGTEGPEAEQGTTLAE